LLPKLQRSDNGYKRYGKDEVSRLHFIQKSKQLGFANNEVRELLALSLGTGLNTRAEVKVLTKNHIDSIKQKINELKKVKKSLTRVFKECDGAAERADLCPILLSLFDHSPQNASLR